MTDAMFSAFNRTDDLRDISRSALRNATYDMDFPSLSLVVEEISASGVILFEIETYTLTKNWLETVLVGILAVAQIAAGIALMATSGFLGTLLLTQGINDMIGVVTAVWNGAPMDFGQYLKGKGMSIAISLLTAGALQGINRVFELKLPLFADLTKYQIIGIHVAVAGATAMIEHRIYS